ncbi:HIT family protein [Patescibacteria group bacterium]
MDDCIFCKIIKGDIPSYKVYEDDFVFAFLDISPATKGHTLIIPKEHYENILDIPNDLLYKISEVSKKLALKYEGLLKSDGFNILQSSKEHAQQEVNHYHMHLIPRYKGDRIDFWITKKENPIEDDLESTCLLLS